MSEISKEAKAKACEIVGGWTADGLLENVGAFVQQVSDAAKEIVPFGGQQAHDLLAPLILPDPVDPLFDVIWEIGLFSPNTTHLAVQQTNKLREALERHGLQIVPVQQP